MLPAILSLLASKGLSILAEAVIAKGKSAIEDKLGIKLPSSEAELTPELTAKLLEVQNAHQQFLITSALEEKKVEAASEEAASKEVTARWVADMASDNSLSKNTRPGVLIFLTLTFSAMTLFDMEIREAYIAIFGQLLLLVFGAYFVGRSAEKVVDMTVSSKKKGS